MSKKSANTNPVVMRRGEGIGSSNAENDDEFLFNCFVDHPVSQACARVGSPVSVIAGRTGSGKTAIIRHIERTAEHSVIINPFEMSMSYVSNSDVLRFLNAIGADLDLLFQALWKHVLCIEFIRLRWGVDSPGKSENIFSRIVDRFSPDARKTKAINYLREWQGKFWVTMDQNIREITESVEKKLLGEIGGEIEKFRAGGQYEKRMSRDKKSEIVARTRKIISSEQLAELHGVVDMLSISDGDGMKTFYIMIDRLDEKWVDGTVRFRLIKALIETLKSFRKITNLKVLVALRDDVIERVVQETQDITFQREKFEDATIKLTWTKVYLRELVDKRLNELFRRQYTGCAIGFDDIFPREMGRSKSTFDWICERTHMRPRDIIAFVNEAISAADGQTSISVSALRRAEVEFSRKRRDALVQEWMSAYPSIERLLTYVTSRRRPHFEALELLDGVDDLSLDICTKGSKDFDPIFTVCSTYLDSKMDRQIGVTQHAVATLYRVGAIGLKLSPQDRFVYAHINQPLVSPDLVTVDTKIRIHPMLQAAYNMRDIT